MSGTMQNPNGSYAIAWLALGQLGQNWIHNSQWKTEHGGIPYIRISVTGETHVAPLKCSIPFDADLIE